MFEVLEYAPAKVTKQGVLKPRRKPKVVAQFSTLEQAREFCRDKSHHVISFPVAQLVGADWYKDENLVGDLSDGTESA